MNKPDTNIAKKGIIVIESLPYGQQKTGEELYNDQLRYKKYLNDDVFVNYYAVSSAPEFMAVLKRISGEMKAGEVFSLHFETHGHDDGIALNSGEVIPWKLFYDLIRPINIKMGHLLIIVMAMCKGGALVSYLDIKQRAPYKLFIGAFKNVTVDAISRGFGAFYENFNSVLDIANAFNALCLEVDGHLDANQTRTFWMFSEEEILKQTFDLDRDPVFLAKQISRECEKELAKGVYIPVRVVEEKYRFIMHDIYVNNKDFYCFRDIYKL